MSERPPVLEAVDESCSPGTEGAGAEVLDAVRGFLVAHVAFPSGEAADAVALWAAHCHLVQSFESTPRLALLSPEKGSGKTRTLEVLRLLVPNPIEIANATPAAVFRLIGKGPTLLFDEADTYFGPAAAKQHEELRGLVNAGHRRGAMAYRCVGEPARMRVEAFPAFCAVALAGIGELPDTITDRGVVIAMRRRRPDEGVVPYRERLTGPTGRALGDRLAAWAGRIAVQAADYVPEMPIGLSDRPADVWEPLLTIADLAGGEWPDRSRKAAVKLNAERATADPSWGVRLLADLRAVWPAEAEHMASATLLLKLNALDEAPWGDLHGKPLDARGLARRLRPYGIRPRDVRLGGDAKAKGYSATDLHDAWVRYLPPSPPDKGDKGDKGDGELPSVADGVVPVADSTALVADRPGVFDIDVADVADVAPPRQRGAGAVAEALRV